MNLDELDEEIKKKEAKEAAWKKASEEPVTEYLIRKATEDTFLRQFQCPTCKLDVKMSVINTNEHYHCQGNHYFVRYIPLHPVEFVKTGKTQYPIVITMPDDKKEEKTKPVISP